MRYLVHSLAIVEHYFLHIGDSQMVDVKLRSVLTDLILAYLITLSGKFS